VNRAEQKFAAWPTNGGPFRVAPRAWRTGDQRRLGASADLQAFFASFPNFGLFSPSFSKVSFGGFAGFQWVTVAAKPIKSSFQIFGLLPWLEEPVARRQTRLDR
jgi:hypothetical protein